MDELEAREPHSVSNVEVVGLMAANSLTLPTAIYWMGQMEAMEVESNV